MSKVMNTHRNRQILFEENDKFTGVKMKKKMTYVLEYIMD